MLWASKPRSSVAVLNEATRYYHVFCPRCPEAGGRARTPFRLGASEMNDRPQSFIGRIVEKSGWQQISGPLFRKYVALFLAVVCVALLSNGIFEIWFSYDEHNALQIQIQ